MLFISTSLNCFLSIILKFNLKEENYFHFKTNLTLNKMDLSTNKSQLISLNNVKSFNESKTQINRVKDLRLNKTISLRKLMLSQGMKL